MRLANSAAKGICAGKHSVADYLVEQLGFSKLYLARTAATPLVEKSASEARVPVLSRAPRETSTDDETFLTVQALVDFVTKRWQQRWVTTDVWDEAVLEMLSRRPFFILVSVDAPVSIRWSRFKERCELYNQQSPTLEEFVVRNDDHLYDAVSGLARLINRAEVRLVNSTSSLEQLRDALKDLDLANEQRLRPSWDQYFMQLASLAAQRSNCMKRRVGCVLVREKRVISTGYNGTPRNLRNCNEGGCPRCNDGYGAGVELSTCLCIHAEENALLEAGRERIRERSILYCDTIKITQVGISEVVYSQAYSMDRKAAAVFAEGGIMLRQFSPVSVHYLELKALFP
ncbi:deoxycytidylate deaminase [Lasallia pustulata]|uniref:Deoxycytidylate deaminase n=1 Tax=Lasallia pustulata TaxID=136370 RepID=A0A1W5CWV1_9LECA|nr:deoxycytidylate deaminase [Lasallia pustulata]